jgi:hypothetical protein
MVHAVAEGARETGTNVDIKRVPERVRTEVAKASRNILDLGASMGAPRSPTLARPARRLHPASGK